MQPKNYSHESLALALSNITFEDFSHFTPKLFNAISIDVLIHGNWIKETALTVTDNIIELFSSSLCQSSQVNTICLDIKNRKEIAIPISLSDHDYAVVIYYPMPDKTLKTIALTMLTTQMLSPIFFQKMRTEQQFGYLVGVSFVPINCYPGIAFYIQSPEIGSTELTIAMNAFIGHANDYINGLPEQHWRQIQAGLASQLEEKETSLRIKSQRYWASICNKEQSFAQKSMLIDIIKSLSISDVSDFVLSTLQGNSKDERILLMTYKNNSEQEEMLHHFHITNDVAALIKNIPVKY